MCCKSLLNFKSKYGAADDIQRTVELSQKNITLLLKWLSSENKHTKLNPNQRSIEIQKVLQNIKKYCKINDDNSDEQLLAYIARNTPIGTQETIIYGSKQFEIDDF